MICSECGGTLRETREPVVEEYRGERFSVSGIRHFVCDACGNYELLAEDAELLSEKIAAQYEERHKLLTPAEIRETRASLGMTQVEFEELLGVSSPTCSRWENGVVQQSKTVDRLIRVIAGVSGAREFLEQLGKVSTANYAAEIIPFIPPTRGGAHAVTPSFESTKEG